MDPFGAILGLYGGYMGDDSNRMHVGLIIMACFTQGLLTVYYVVGTC